MTNLKHPIIAREGWLFLAISFIVSSLITYFLGGLASLPFWIITLFILQFFRDPIRIPPGDKHTVISPADGRIVAVEKTHDPYLKRDALKISVFMNVFNVHSNRSPVDGEVKQIWYNPGYFINAALDKASQANERNALWIKTSTGKDITCVQIAGLIARRILCYVKVGDPLQRGMRFGFIRFGSRVDVYLPLDAEIKTVIGSKAYGGMTVLAELGDRG